MIAIIAGHQGLNKPNPINRIRKVGMAHNTTIPTERATQIILAKVAIPKKISPMINKVVIFFLLFKWLNFPIQLFIYIDNWFMTNTNFEMFFLLSVTKNKSDERSF